VYPDYQRLTAVTGNSWSCQTSQNADQILKKQKTINKPLKNHKNQKTKFKKKPLVFTSPVHDRIQIYFGISSQTAYAPCFRLQAARNIDIIRKLLVKCIVAKIHTSDAFS
jgi:hypothetical protein